MSRERKGKREKELVDSVYKGSELLSVEIMSDLFFMKILLLQ